MAEIVRLEVKPRPKRGKQDGIMRTSYAMFLMLADIEGMENHGGCPLAGLHIATRRALSKRGLIAVYRSYGNRACLSPVGRNVIQAWRSRLSR